MATRFTLTITTSNADGETRSAERENIKYLLKRVAQQVGDGVSTSGTVVDRRSNPSTTWTYTPTAAS